MAGADEGRPSIDQFEGGSEGASNARNRDVTYRSRPFSDLVDEDKHGFVKRRILATVLGGFRTVVDEASETSAGLALILTQLLIYLIVPGWVALATVIFKDNDQRVLAIVLGGAFPFVINGLVMGISASFLNSLQARKEPDLEPEDESPSCLSRAAFMFLFPPKSGGVEIALCSLTTFAFGSTMVYVLHPRTLAYFYGAESDTELGGYIPLLLLIGLSSFGLFSARCPESAVYLNNDQELNWGSNHYQRPIYYILIAAFLMVCEATEPTWLTSSGVDLVYALFIITYFLQVCGILSHPIVTILWLME